MDNNSQLPSNKSLFEPHDCTVVVRGKHFHVHKEILMDVSPVFKAMLLSFMIEGTSNQIVIDTDPAVFDTLLRTLYGQPLTNKILAAEAIELMFLANKYQIDTLAKVCGDYCSKNLTVNNALKVVLLAETIASDELMQAAIGFIVANSSTDGLETIVDNVAPGTAQLLITTYGKKHQAARTALSEVKQLAAANNRDYYAGQCGAAVTRSGVLD